MHDEVHDHFKTANYILLFLLVIILLGGVFTASLIENVDSFVDLMTRYISLFLIVPSIIFIVIIILYLALQHKHYNQEISDSLWMILLSLFILFMVCLVIYGLICVLILIRIGHWMTMVSVLLTLIAIGNIYFPASMIYHIKNDEK